jgi:hypothetical protein
MQLDLDDPNLNETLDAPRERINSTTEAERLDDIAVAAAIAEVEAELKSEASAGLTTYLTAAVGVIVTGVVLQRLDIVTFFA